MDIFNEIKLKFSDNPGINGEEEFKKSAVLLLLIEKNGEYYIVFEKRASNIRQGGEISLPGGMFDKKLDKNSKETAIRETEEELGIDKKYIKVYKKLSTLIAPFGAIIEPYLAFADITVDQIVFNKDEVEKVIFIPLKFFIDNKPEKYSILFEATPYKIDKNGDKKWFFPVEKFNLPDRYMGKWGEYRSCVYLFKYKDEIVWGLTAKIVVDFIKKCKKWGIKLV